MFAPGCDENFFWTRPALTSAESAHSFYQTDDWHNSGGDRTWLSPELDVFFPNFPDTSIWRVPAEIDPGSYAIVRSGLTVRFESKFTVTLSRCCAQVEGRIAKSWGPALDPLRHEQVWGELTGVAYAGNTQETSLEFLTNSNNSAQVGLWNLLALPHGGEVIIPTHTQEEPRVYAGPIAPADLVVTEHLVRFWIRAPGFGRSGFARWPPRATRSRFTSSEKLLVGSHAVC